MLADPHGEGPLGARRRGARAPRRRAPPVRDGGRRSSPRSRCRARIDRVPLGAANVVPCELDGERILALVATGLERGAARLELAPRAGVGQPALRSRRGEGRARRWSQDLSPISRQLGVPIKALIGAKLLRHAHATFDRRGDQFVVRRQDAPPPPDASRVPLYYLRGGGMVLRATVTRARRRADPAPGRQLASVPAPPPGRRRGRRPASTSTSLDADPRRADREARRRPDVSHGRLRSREDAGHRGRRPRRR